jgi:demethylmenaquinone methyltransferase/2-methoxy-6-polyprenyl-1,4-benzoquinol methylase
MSHPPLPPRPQYWTREEDRQRVVTGMFDRSARHYDRACNVMSLGSGSAYRHAALGRAGLRPRMSVLDVGSGTGLLARAAASVVGPAGKVTAVDPSFEMMTAGPHHGEIGLVQGVGEVLPFAAGVFDFVTIGYALRHVSDLDQMFAEYARVLKPAGRVLILEITKPRSTIGAALARAYFGIVTPCVTRLATGSADASRLMRFYWDTIAHCVPPDVILASLRRAGFSAGRTVVGGVFSEYLATRNA